MVGRLVDTYHSFQLPMLLFASTTVLAALFLIPLKLPTPDSLVDAAAS